MNVGIIHSIAVKIFFVSTNIKQIIHIIPETRDIMEGFELSEFPFIVVTIEPVRELIIGYGPAFED